ERPDFDQLKSHYNPQENEIRYFTGNDSIDTTPITKAYLKVRGIHLTKAEQYKQYIKQNYSPELIESFKEFHKMPESKKNHTGFNHSLTDTHFEQLANLINDIKLFTNQITKEQVKAMFDLSINAPIQVNHNPRLAWLFNCLKNAQLIADEWQSIVEQNNLFTGKKGSKITANNLAKSLSTINQQNKEIKQISKAVAAIKQ